MLFMTSPSAQRGAAPSDPRKSRWRAVQRRDRSAQFSDKGGGSDSELPPRGCFYGRLGMRHMHAPCDWSCGSGVPRGVGRTNSITISR